MKHYICHYCKLDNPKVEASGVWYCPNGICPGPGAAWFRAKLKSYKENGGSNGEHTIDEKELHKAWEQYLGKKEFEKKYGIE